MSSSMGRSMRAGLDRQLGHVDDQRGLAPNVLPRSKRPVTVEFTSTPDVLLEPQLRMEVSMCSCPLDYPLSISLQV